MRRPSGGKGSNQYVSRGQSSAGAGSRASAVAAGFSVDALVDEPPHWRRKLDERDDLTEADWWDILERGDNDYHHDLAAAVRNPAAPGWFISKMLDSESLGVRLNATRHPNCPVDKIIEALNRPGLGASAAYNPSCPVDAIRDRLKACAEGTLADSQARGDNDFLTGASSRESLPEDVQLLIATEVTQMQGGAYASSVHNGFIRSMATPRSVVSVVYQHNAGDLQTVERVAAHPNCPPPILEKLSRHRSQTVQRFVSLNPACPPAVIEKFAKSSREQTRVAAAKHPHASASMLERLWSTDPSPAVRSAVAENPACPEHIRIGQAFSST